MQDFIRKKGYPSWTNVTLVPEGAETISFKQNFVDWLNKNETDDYSLPKGLPLVQIYLIELHTLPVLAAPEIASSQKFDVDRTYKPKQKNMVDDGKGELAIWRIEDLKMAPVDLGMYGQFFGGDSYVILYTYLVKGKERYIIYYWQVRTIYAPKYYN